MVLNLRVCVSDERAAFDKWVKENGPNYSFTIGYDPTGKQKLGKDVMHFYGVVAIPTTYVLDPDGKILAVCTGLTPENRKALLQLLEEKASRRSETPALAGWRCCRSRSAAAAPARKSGHRGPAISIRRRPVEA